MADAIHYDDAPQLLKNFLFYMLTIKGRSRRTVDAYYRDLSLMLRFLTVHRSGQHVNGDDLAQIDISGLNESFFRGITLMDLYEYMNYVTSDRSNQSATRARKISSMRGFFNYLSTKIGILEDNPAAGLEAPSIRKNLPKYLTLEQAMELLNAVSGDYAERDYCILTLFLNCGMRLSELVGIDLNDFKPSEHSLKLLGKGNKERIIYLNEACESAINRYLPIRNKSNVKIAHRQALFISKNGTRLSARRVEEIVTAYLKKSGLDGLGFSTHKLRHTAATLMYQHGGVDIRVLKEVLGHTNIATTEIYTHVSNAQVEEAMASSPLAKVKPKK